jgi:hypothetical protein
VDFKDLAIGRIVHFVLSPGEHRPAIVTRVVDKKIGLVNLNVLRDYEDAFWAPHLAGGKPEEYGSSYTVANVYPSETSPVRTWHWSERED